MYSALILLYAATAAVAGYVSASYYRQMQGTLWARNILLTCVIFAGPLFCTFCFNNTIAIVYEVRHFDIHCHIHCHACHAVQTTAALPWQTIVILIVLWALVTLPLTIAGGIVGSAWLPLMLMHLTPPQKTTSVSFTPLCAPASTSERSRPCLPTGRPRCKCSWLVRTLYSCVLP